MRLWKVLLPLLASAVCLAQQPDRIAGPIDSSRMVTLPGHVNRNAAPQYDQGPVEPSFQLGYVTLLIAPSPSQEIALDQLLAQQQDRTSPNYHKWLTPEQYANRFGLSKNDINKITAWLESQGFTILRVARGRNAVIFSGTAAQIQTSFNTEIHRYQVNGEKHIANSTSFAVPAALSGVVTGIRGLTDFRLKPMYARPPRHAPHPGYTTTIDGGPEYFLAPGDLATIYDINPLYNAVPPIDGTGETFAIMGQTDIYLADLVDFRAGFNLPSFTCTTGATGLITACNTTNFSYVLLGTDPGSPSLGDLFEADLDVEWSGAIARNAQIIFVNAETAGGVNDALAYAIDNTIAPVISMSYGLCEAENYPESLETELKMGNNEGITIMNSADDTGSAGCDNGPPGGANPPLPFGGAVGGLAVSYPASSPEVTAVGGTSIPSNDYTSTFWGPNNGTNGGSALTTLVGQEVSWNDDAAFALFCQGEPSNTFCTEGAPPTAGWVPITNAQTAQEDLWISAGGGGVSNCFTETAGICSSGFAIPAWQQGLTIPGLTSPQTTYRFVPDVSLLASPNFPGYIICTPQEELGLSGGTASSCAGGIASAADEFSLVGGTSASTPVFAGIVTLLNQYLAATPGLGNINPSLYTVAASPAAGAFHQVTSGDNNVYCQAGTPAGEPADVICPTAGVFGFSASSADATTGYNLVTGLGSVDANKLAIALKPDFQLTTTPLTPASIPAGQSAGSVLTIAPIAGSVGMVVNFSPSSCTGLPTGATCSFNPTSVTFDGVDDAMTTLTISTLPNMATSSATTVTVIPTNSPSTPVTVSLTVTTTLEKFTLATSAATFPVTVGASVSVPITVTGTNGFIVGTGSSATTVLPLTYSCSGVPALGAAEISCQLPNNGQPTNATGVTISLVTTAPTTKLLRPLSRGSRIFYALLLPGLFGIVFAAGSRSRGLRLLSLMVVLGFSTLWLGACGGGNGGTTGLQNPGTPVGTYAVTINATTGGADPVTSVLGPITINVTAQ
jgi:subtilase family serine protease